LPTEAEWNYAAAGGSEQRFYPWSDPFPPGSETIDGTYAAYGCLTDGSPQNDCAFTDILPVGSRSPKGDGRWGQADLGGNMDEWNLDYGNFTYPMPRNDCANLISAYGRRTRGGCWQGPTLSVRAGEHGGSGPPRTPPRPYTGFAAPATCELIAGWGAGVMTSPKRPCPPPWEPRQRGVEAAAPSELDCAASACSLPAAYLVLELPGFA